MAESLKGGFGYRKVSAVFDAPPLSVVGDDRLLAISKALLRLARPQASRFLFTFAAYLVVLSASLWLSYQLRFDFNVPASELEKLYVFWSWMVPVKIGLLLLIAQLDGLVSYFSVPDLEKLFLALCTGLFLFASIWWISGGELAPSRGVLVIDLVVSFLALAGLRLSLRLARERFLSPASHSGDRLDRVAIIGAGDAGAALARELFAKRHLGLRPVAFFDDDPFKWGARIHHIPVIGGPESLVRERTNLKLDKVILALPSASQRRFRELVNLLQRMQVPFESVPALDHLATGKVKITQLRSICPDDLIDHPDLHLDAEKIGTLLEGRVVMVTGAGGSIGGELCRRIAAFRPRQILLLDQCEVHLFQVEQELIQMGHGEVIRPIVGDILDSARMRRIFEMHRPAIVLHAAGHKHSALLESEPAEAIQTNTLGAVQIAKLALEFGVARFALISATAAAKPSDVVGSAKRLAEEALRALFAEQNKRDGLVVVRFAELTESATGVLRRFDQEIASGGPVRITHPNAICYSLTTGDAAQLVLQALVHCPSEDVVVLEMGKPLKLLDLAYRAIEFAGLVPDQDIEIEFTAPRNPDTAQGRESSAARGALKPTAHPRLLHAATPHRPWEIVGRHVQKISEHLAEEPETIARLIRNAIDECVPELDAGAEHPVKRRPDQELVGTPEG